MDVPRITELKVSSCFLCLHLPSKEKGGDWHQSKGGISLSQLHGQNLWILWVCLLPPVQALPWGRHFFHCPRDLFLIH